MKTHNSGGIVQRLNQRSRRWDIRKNWQLYLLLLLPVTYIIVFAYFPMGGTVIAFKDFRVKKGIWGSPWVGLKHFENFFTTPNFSLLLKNTLSLSIYTLLAGFPFPILLALAINECFSKKYRKAVQMITYAPYFISTVVLVGIMSNFFSLRTGFVNSVANLLGAEQVNYMGIPGLFRHLYV